MFEGLLLAGIAYGGYRLAKYVSHTLQPRRQNNNGITAGAEIRRRLAEQRASRLRAAQKMRRANRDMQVALFQLRQCPDFRRAASLVARAQSVPLAFRQRQFQRFRPFLVEHLAARLDQGASLEAIMLGLTELVTGLGVAGFEADYIRLDAERKLRVRETPAVGYADRIRQLQASHTERVELLRTVPGLENELREQLIELENERLRESLMAVSEGEGNQVNGSAQR